MPWCPKCREEYIDGIMLCSECEVELVDKLEEVVEKEEKYDKEEFLVTVNSLIEAHSIESLLNSNNIPVLKKSHGAYVTEFSVIGTSYSIIDIYVPSKKLELAKEMLESKPVEPEMFDVPDVEYEEDEGGEDEGEEEYDEDGEEEIEVEDVEVEEEEIEVEDVEEDDDKKGEVWDQGQVKN